MLSFLNNCVTSYIRAQVRIFNFLEKPFFSYTCQCKREEDLHFVLRGRRGVVTGCAKFRGVGITKRDATLSQMLGGEGGSQKMRAFLMWQTMRGVLMSGGVCITPLPP